MESPIPFPNCNRLSETSHNKQINTKYTNMRTKLITLFSLLACAVSAFGHGEIKIGPSGGRVLPLSEDAKTLGEISVKNGKFQIEVLDKEMKAVPLSDQELSVTAGDRAKPEKLAVEKEGGKYFVAPTAKAGDWVILQFKKDAKAKPFTARFQYDTALSKDGKTPNWLHAH